MRFLRKLLFEETGDEVVDGVEPRCATSCLRFEKLQLLAIVEVDQIDSHPNVQNFIKNRHQLQHRCLRKSKIEYSKEGTTAAGTENEPVEANQLIKEKNIFYLLLNGVYLWASKTFRSFLLFRVLWIYVSMEIWNRIVFSVSCEIHPKHNSFNA